MGDSSTVHCARRVATGLLLFALIATITAPWLGAGRNIVEAAGIGGLLLAPWLSLVIRDGGGASRPWIVGLVALALGSWLIQETILWLSAYR